MNIIPLFCEIDDCFLALEKQKVPTQLPEMPHTPKKRGRPRSLHTSEVMTIVIQPQCPSVRTDVLQVIAFFTTSPNVRETPSDGSMETSNSISLSTQTVNSRQLCLHPPTQTIANPSSS